MKKYILLSICLFFAAVAVNAKVLSTGDSVKVISGEWLDNKPHRIEEFKNKKVVVLFLWELDNNGLAVIQAMNRLDKLFSKKDIACFGIAHGDKMQVLKFPGVKQLPFPVCADPGKATAATLLRSYDQLPMAVVIDKNGILN